MFVEKKCRYRYLSAVTYNTRIDLLTIGTDGENNNNTVSI